MDVWRLQSEASGSRASLAISRALHHGSKIMIVSGAGISQSAGVPEYSSLRKKHKVDLDISAYTDKTRTIQLHELINDLHEKSAMAKPTEWHKLMDSFAREDRLLRHYTQNVDCIEQRLPHLSTRSVQLHGRVDEFRCHQCGSSGPAPPRFFSGSDLPDCPRCQEYADRREMLGRRRPAVGRLRPNVVLCGEAGHHGTEIGRTLTHDLNVAPDVVVVVGTKLKIDGARELVRDLCRAARVKGGFTLWLNKTAPPSRMRDEFDVVLLGDCQQLASWYLAVGGLDSQVVNPG